MTVDALVIGAASPLGRRLAVHLATSGRAVGGTSRGGGDDLQALEVADLPQVERVLGSLRPRTVVYLADPDSAEAPSRLHDLAVAGARSGMELLVFASSAAVYGTSRPSPSAESDARQPETDYGRRKAHSEDALAVAAAVAGFHAVSLRVFNVYGPGFDRSLVNRLGRAGLEPPGVYRSAEFVRDYIHVDDVCRAFGATLDAPPLESPAVFNVGSGRGIDNLTLLSAAPGPFVELGDPPRPSWSVADIRRIRTQWGFDPAVDVLNALADPADFLFD